MHSNFASTSFTIGRLPAMVNPLELLGIRARPRYGDRPHAAPAGPLKGLYHTGRRLAPRISPDLPAGVVDLVQGRERRALDVFQKGTAPGRDVGHALRQPEFLDRLRGLAAAHHGDRPRVGQRLGDGPRPLAVRCIFVLAERTVPDHHARPADLLPVMVNGLRPDIDPDPAVGNVA